MSDDFIFRCLSFKYSIYIIVWYLLNNRMNMVGQHELNDTIHTIFVVRCAHLFICVVYTCRDETEIIPFFNEIPKIVYLEKSMINLLSG